MSLRFAVPRVIGGLRCPRCGKFTETGEGAAIFLCCWFREKPRNAARAPTMEHHAYACIHQCGEACACPCHEQLDLPRQEGGTYYLPPQESEV